MKKKKSKKELGEKEKLYLMYNVCICALKASEIYGGRQMTCKNIKVLRATRKSLRNMTRQKESIRGGS